MRRMPLLACLRPHAQALPLNSSSTDVPLSHSSTRAMASVSSSSAFMLMPPPARALRCLRTRESRDGRPWARSTSASRSTVDIINITLPLGGLGTTYRMNLSDTAYRRAYGRLTGAPRRVLRHHARRAGRQIIVKSVLRERAISRERHNPLCDALHAHGGKRGDTYPRREAPRLLPAPSLPLCCSGVQSACAKIADCTAQERLHERPASIDASLAPVMTHPR